MITAVRTAAAGLCALVVLYWLGVAWRDASGGGFRALLVLLGALAVSLAIAAGVRGRANTVARALALGLGLYALAGAFLLLQWIHADSERYLWVIRQPAPCTYMGGGPGGLAVMVTAAVFAAGAMCHAFAGGISGSAVVAGLAGASVVLVATVLAMFPDPAVFAWLLGCV